MYSDYNYNWKEDSMQARNDKDRLQFPALVSTHPEEELIAPNFHPSPTKIVRIVEHYKDGDRIREVRMNRKDRRRLLRKIK